MMMLRACALILFVPGFLYADAILRLAPARVDVKFGEPFAVTVVADTDGAAMTAAEAELAFDPALLQVDSVSTGSSVLSSWPTAPIFSNEIGYVRFSGWATNPFDGGVLLEVTFRPVGNGPADVQIVSGALLSSEHHGSNIISHLQSGIYRIEPRLVEPDEEDAQVLGSTIVSRAPRFESYESAIAKGERIVARGSATADAKLTVYLRRETESAEAHVTAAGDGSFTFVSDPLNEGGVYRVTISDAAGESDTIRINVQSRGVSAVAAAGMTLLSLGWPFIVIVLGTALAAGYIMHRYSTIPPESS